MEKKAVDQRPDQIRGSLVNRFEPERHTSLSPNCQESQLEQFLQVLLGYFLPQSIPTKNGQVFGEQLKCALALQRAFAAYRRFASRSVGASRFTSQPLAP